MQFKRLRCVMVLGVLLLLNSNVWAATNKNSDWTYLQSKGFPRLFGMNIGSPKPYDDPQYQQQLAKLDAVVLGFGPDWSSPENPRELRNIVRAIKQINPEILIGQYSRVVATYDRDSVSPTQRDVTEKVYANDWWLKNASGARVRRTDEFDLWDVNFTQWASPDSNGHRFPEWISNRDYRMFFKPIPELDIWYFDSVFKRSPLKAADWNIDGVNDDRDDPAIQSAYRAGHRASWEAARALKPGALIMGNSIDSDLSFVEYKNELNGAFMEAVMGLPWSLESRKGWSAVMDRYHSTMQNTLSPHLVVFHVIGNVDNYRFFRYAYTSSLLDDGYFSFSDVDKGYSTVPWFDEYDVDLGMALDPPTYVPWQGPVYRREFEHGIVLVNPSTQVFAVSLEKPYKRISGTQDTRVNSGGNVQNLILVPKDGVVLLK